MSQARSAVTWLADPDLHRACPDLLSPQESSAEIPREWEISATALTAISPQLGSDPDSAAVRDYIWGAGDPKVRQL